MTAPPRRPRHAILDYRPNALAPSERDVRRVHPGGSLASLVPPGKGPLIAAVNGKWVLKENGGWERRYVAPGDHVMFARLPAGGGGGQGGSNPLRLFLSLALMVVAGPLAGGVSSLLGIGVNVAKAGILLGGSALINAALPVRGAQPGPTASPTYSLDAQGNAARIGAPIPVQYGRVRCYPDLAALPYAEFAGEEQYLYQLFCLGAGEYDVEDIRIEDTPISSFAEVETQICGPGVPVTLFPTQVVTSVEAGGQELLPMRPGTWARTGSDILVTQTAHGLAIGASVLFQSLTGGGPTDVYTVTSASVDQFGISAPGGGTSGTCNIYRMVGGPSGFTASAPGQAAHRLGFDFVFPQGLYSLSDDGDLQAESVQVIADARRIDDSGVPMGTWVNVLNQVIWAKTATPVRRSFNVVLPTPGRYQVRIRRQNGIAPANTFNQVLWAGLRAYLAEEQNFGPVTVIAIKMRATNNLSLQASRRINVLSTRKLPVWNGTTWSAPVPTRSIAWAMADAARNSDYSVGRPDRKVDIAALLALDAVWAARGDTFNFRFDQPGAWWDAMKTIGMAGRAQPYMQASILRVARDRPQSVPVAMFSMRNISKDTFNVEYLMPPANRSTALDVHYFDAETWAPEKVRVDLFASGSAPPARIELPGADNRPQVMREGAYQSAATRYRRRLITFETEMEGFTPAPMDLISIQHDMPGWGAQAEVRLWRPADRMLTLTEPVAVAADTVVALRRPDGSPWGPVAVTQGATEYEVALAETPDFTPITAQDRERTHVAIGTSDIWSMPALFLRAVPRGLHRVLIEAVSEDPAVHTAELGITPPPRRASLLPRAVTRPEVAGLFARLVPGDTTRAVFGWRPAAGADFYRIEMAEGFDPADPDAVWTPMAEISAASIALPLLHPRRTMVRVQGIGLAPGPWVSATLGSLIGSFWVGAASDPFWIGTGTDPFWRNT